MTTLCLRLTGKELLSVAYGEKAFVRHGVPYNMLVSDLSLATFVCDDGSVETSAFVVACIVEGKGAVGEKGFHSLKGQ